MHTREGWTYGQRNTVRSHVDRHGSCVWPCSQQCNRQRAAGPAQAIPWYRSLMGPAQQSKMEGKSLLIAPATADFEECRRRRGGEIPQDELNEFFGLRPWYEARSPDSEREVAEFPRADDVLHWFPCQPPPQQRYVARPRVSRQRELRGRRERLEARVVAAHRSGQQIPRGEIGFRHRRALEQPDGAPIRGGCATGGAAHPQPSHARRLPLVSRNPPLQDPPRASLLWAGPCMLQLTLPPTRVRAVSGHRHQRTLKVAQRRSPQLEFTAAAQPRLGKPAPRVRQPEQVVVP